MLLFFGYGYSSSIPSGYRYPRPQRNTEQILLLSPIGYDTRFFPRIDNGLFMSLLARTPLSWAVCSLSYCFNSQMMERSTGYFIPCQHLLHIKI